MKDEAALAYLSSAVGDAHSEISSIVATMKMLGIKTIIVLERVLKRLG